METARALDVLAAAHDRLRRVVAGVPADGWGGPTPCAEWTVRQVFNHARLGQVGYGGAALGEEILPVEVRFNPLDALDGDPAELLEAGLRCAADAYAGLPAGAEAVRTPLGELPVWLGATAAALDCAVHAWDIAVATGQPSPLDDGLADGLWPVARHFVDDVREEHGVYAGAIGQRFPTRATSLLAHMGRHPGWRIPGTPAALAPLQAHFRRPEYEPAVAPGWWELVLECHRAVEAEFPAYELLAVKQKYGELAFRARPGAGQEADRRLNGILAVFVERSRATCERCGADGAQLREGRWITLTLCGPCEAAVGSDGRL